MWMRIDDGLHAHRKVRSLLSGGQEKRRDSAPMGLWILAGSWAARNNQDGWVPADELDRFDDDWEAFAERLVASGFWWPEDRNGEQGYGFNDWEEWNRPDLAATSGKFGNHVRWHVKKGVEKPDCEHCPQEPGHPNPVVEPDHRGDVGATSLGASPRVAPDIARSIAPISLRDDRPDSLTHTHPIPNPTQKHLSDEPDEPAENDRFEDFWDTYGKKVDRKAAEAKWRLALKKPGVTADLLITAAASYTTAVRAESGNQYVMGPAKWLLGERWSDERAGRPHSQFRPMTPEEKSELPPSGLSDVEYLQWEHDRREHRRVS